MEKDTNVRLSDKLRAYDISSSVDEWNRSFITELGQVEKYFDNVDNGTKAHTHNSRRMWTFGATSEL